MERFWYYLGCFLAIAIMESVPRFVFEAAGPWLLLDHALLIALFIAGAWFFKRNLHEPWKWSVLSSMFFVDAIVTVCVGLLLFLQLFSPWFAIITGLVIITRAAAFSYIVSDRLPHLRSLVFFTGFFFLICGELVLTFGLQIF